MCRIRIGMLIMVSFISCLSLSADRSQQPRGSTIAALTRDQAARFSALALKCICKEYPNKPEHVLNVAADVQSPRALHPAFYGCFDWHSSVHGHWMLVRLLRLFPGLSQEKEIRTALDNNLTAENLRTEASYMDAPNRQSFERMYGWAWLLKLHEELWLWQDSDGQRWFRNLQPLASAIVIRYLDFLPRQNYPIRTGVHPNTAFALAFGLDYARTTGNRKLEAMIGERALTYYMSDMAYPASWEPGGEDFFSPCLMEADLMRRVLKPAEFRAWFRRLLPGIGRGEPKSLFEPAIVTDRSDPKLVHLDGLNLSRAWCMLHVAAALPEEDPARPILAASGSRHAQAALSHVASGDYVGEHWLASFAVYLLSLPAQ